MIDMAGKNEDGKEADRRGKAKTMVLSLGGSLIVPDDINADFLGSFTKAASDFVKDGRGRLIIVCGGGATNSRYNKKAEEIAKMAGGSISGKSLDWIGIASSRLNAELVKSLFGELAPGRVVYDPNESLESGENAGMAKVVIAAGWKPGWSTDYDAVVLAWRNGADMVINLTNIDHVYDKDPKKHNDAKKLESLSWGEYMKIIGEKWEPRMNAPFDPIASKLAMLMAIKALFADGWNIGNIRMIVSGEKVVGTLLG